MSDLSLETKVIHQDIDTPEKAAQLTGLPTNRIGVIRLQLERLLSEGMLIELDIHGESMFATQADWPEFGINHTSDEIRLNRMTRGRKYLIDEKRIADLRTVTTRMRQWLAKLTYDITGFKPWRYLNYKRYPEWVEQWGALLSQFNSVKDDILANYDADIEALRVDYNDIATRSWHSMIALGYSEIIYAGQKYTSLETFRQAMVTIVLSKVPPLEVINQGLHADYRVSVLQGRNQIEAQAIENEKQRARAEKIKAKAKADSEKLQAEADMAKEQQRHELEMHEMEELEKRAKIEAMISAEAAHIREQYADTISPVEEVFQQVRGQFADICFSAVESVKKNGYVRGKTAEKLRGLVDFYETISIQDDEKLLLKLQELKKIIGPVASERTENTPDRDMDDVLVALQGIVDLNATAKQDLDEEIKRGPSRAGLVW
jgi:hypothetical protein